MHCELLTPSQGNFTMNVEAGSFTDSEILVMLGENGTGKTTFIRMLAGKRHLLIVELPAASFVLSTPFFLLPPNGVVMISCQSRHELRSPSYSPRLLMLNTPRRAAA